MLARLLPLWLSLGVVMDAAVVGTNPPARALTTESIATLPASEQPAWQRYLAKSRAQRARDQAFLAAELQRTGLKAALVPPKASVGRSLPLGEKPAWYAGAEARRRAQNLVTFQTPAGGWSKGFDATDHPRATGEGFAASNISKHLSPGDHDQPAELNWSSIGTFDNEIGSNRRLFGDRDKSIHDDVNGISPERRSGYGWYSTGPARTLEQYARWAPRFPTPGGR